MKDYVTRSGAYDLIIELEKYWRNRGYFGLKAEVFQVVGGDHPIFGVRSNMINGFPPREKVQ